MKIGFVIVIAATLSFSGLALAQTDEFPRAMDAAMVRMHGAMMVSYSGDADNDFARMMIPHHQGAIDMANIELRYGKDERLRRLAQGIIIEQLQEIAVMQSVLSTPTTLPPRNDPQSSGHNHLGVHP